MKTAFDTAPNPVGVSPTHAPARRYAGYLLFTLCCGIYLLPFMRLSLLGADEGTLIEGAVRILHGQVFARDFFEIEGPGTFYWVAIFLKLFGATFLATRLCLFVTSLGTGVLMYFLSRRICTKYAILPCIVLAATYFGLLWPTISHHVDSNFFALLSVASMALWQERRRAVFLLAAGAAAGITTCFHQPKGMLLLVALLLCLWAERKGRLAALKPLGIVAVGYIAVAGLVLVYFWSQHALGALIYANFLWPAVHYGGVNGVPYAQGLLRSYWDNWAASDAGIRWAAGMAMASVLFLPLLFVAVLPLLLPILGLCSGIWRARGAGRRETIPNPRITLFWLCGWALWISEFHRRDIFHLVFGSPLLIILCVYYLEQYRTKIADIALQLLVISSVCVACSHLFVILAAHPERTRVGTVEIFKRDPILKVLEDHAAPGEEIFSYPYDPMYYFLSATTNPTRYSILLYDFNTPSQFEEVIRVLDQRRVKYVVWDTAFAVEEEAGLRFPSARHMRPDELIFEPYLESHYNVVWSGNGRRLMERKSTDR